MSPGETIVWTVGIICSTVLILGWLATRNRSK